MDIIEDEHFLPFSKFPFFSGCQEPILRFALKSIFTSSQLTLLILAKEPNL